MKITVFTSNQARHLALIADLAQVADQVFAVQECGTVFPGKVEDFYRRSEVMQRYFERVIEAERVVFGDLTFSQSNVSHLAIKDGDLNRLSLDTLAPALSSDIYIVFGADFIKGALCDFLIAHRAYNIHMGTSPYYRGSSCNFWAMYDHHPDYVGATIHMLSKGLDSGEMLFHAFPAPGVDDPFVLGMSAVKAAHHSLINAIRANELQGLAPVPQDKSLEIRYTRNRDFTDEVAQDYLDHLPSGDFVRSALAARDQSRFLRPFIDQA